MGTPLLNVNFDKLNSSLCVATSVILVIIAFIASLKLGEFALQHMSSLF